MFGTLECPKILYLVRTFNYWFARECPFLVEILVTFKWGGFYTLLWVYIGIYLWYGLYLGRAKAAEFGAEKLSEWWPCR